MRISYSPSFAYFWKRTLNNVVFWTRYYITIWICFHIPWLVPFSNMFLNHNVKIWYMCYEKLSRLFFFNFIHSKFLFIVYKRWDKIFRLTLTTTCSIIKNIKNIKLFRCFATIFFGLFDNCIIRKCKSMQCILISLFKKMIIPKLHCFQILIRRNNCSNAEQLNNFANVNIFKM